MKVSVSAYSPARMSPPATAPIPNPTNKNSRLGSWARRNKAMPGKSAEKNKYGPYYHTVSLLSVIDPERTIRSDHGLSVR